MKIRKGLSDETYAMAKVYAKKGELIPKGIIETLAESKDLEDLVGRLKGTVYNEHVSNLSKPYSAEKLEMAFREHLASVHYLFMKITPNSKLLEAYYSKYIVWNLKLVAKGKALGMSYNEIVSKADLYAEELVARRDLIVRAIEAPDLNSLPLILGKKNFGDDLAKAITIYKENNTPQIFDTYLDKSFYSNLTSTYENMGKGRQAKKEKERVEPLISIDIDSYNIISQLRSKLWELSPARSRDLIIQPAFKITIKELERMVEARDIGEALKVVSLTPYRDLIPPELNNETAITKLEDGFQVRSFKEALRSFTWQIEGLGVVLALIKLKEQEVRNLSAIAFGIQQKVGVQAIMNIVTLIP